MCETAAGVQFSCVCLSDNPRQSSHVPVYIRLLDINDNAPTFATVYETFVCERTKAAQVLLLYHIYCTVQAKLIKSGTVHIVLLTV